jgi:pyocin large subunit-like protein
VNNKTLPQSLRALQTQRAVADFIATHQGMEPKRLQAEFVEFAAKLKAEPLPKPDSAQPRRDIKMGGHNE